MGTIVVKNAVKREAGYLYYVDAEGSVCRALMQHKGKAKKESKKLSGAPDNSKAKSIKLR